MIYRNWSVWYAPYTLFVWLFMSGDWMILVYEYWGTSHAITHIYMCSFCGVVYLKQINWNLFPSSIHTIHRDLHTLSFCIITSTVLITLGIINVLSSIDLACPKILTIIHLFLLDENGRDVRGKRFSKKNVDICVRYQL